MHLYQYALIESKLDSFTTYAQLYRARQKVVTYPAFIHLLSNEDQLYEEEFESIFPGIIKKVGARGIQGDGDARKIVGDTTEPILAATTAPSLSVSDECPSYKQANQYLTPGTPFWNRHLHEIYEHLHCKLTGNRMRCVLCCLECKKGRVHTSRAGRQAGKGCSKCRVALCKNCFQAWHSPKPLTVFGVIVCPHAKLSINQQHTTRTVTRRRARAQHV